MKQALFVSIENNEIFFPKIEFCKNYVDIYYHDDVLIENFSEEEQKNLTSVMMVANGKQEIRNVVLPANVEIFDKWYSLLIASKVIHLTVPENFNNFMIFWTKVSFDYGDQINFDILEEILKFEKKRKEHHLLYQNNVNNKLMFLRS